MKTQNSEKLFNICDTILSNEREFNHFLNKIRTKIENKNYDGLIFYFSGHGENDKIILRDGSSFDIKQKIAYKFTNKECSKLTDKPKIMIFDACRHVEVKSSKTSKTSTMRSRKNKLNKLHTYKGFVFLYANFENYDVADLRHGGIFTQAIFSVFEYPEKIKNTKLNDLKLEICKEIEKLGKVRKLSQAPTFEDAGRTKAIYFRGKKGKKKGEDASYWFVSFCL